MNIIQVYTQGAIAHCPAPSVPPMVMSTAIRLMAAVDYGDAVDLEQDGAVARLVYGKRVLAELREQVPEKTVVASIAVEYGSPNEVLITREPLHPGVAASLRSKIEKIEKRAARRAGRQ